MVKVLAVLGLAAVTLIHRPPMVYTVTEIDNEPAVSMAVEEAVWGDAVFHASSGGEEVTFKLDDVNGFIGGIGQHVKVQYIHGFKVVFPCDEWGNE